MPPALWGLPGGLDFSPRPSLFLRRACVPYSRTAFRGSGCRKFATPPPHARNRHGILECQGRRACGATAVRVNFHDILSLNQFRFAVRSNFRIFAVAHKMTFWPSVLFALAHGGPISAWTSPRLAKHKVDATQKSVFCLHICIEGFFKISVSDIFP